MVIFVVDLETGAVEILTLDDFVVGVDAGMISVKTHEVSLDETRAKFLAEAIRDASTRGETL